MDISVSLDELVLACDWVRASDAAALDCEAYVSRATGTVHWCGEGVDDEPPQGIDDGNLFVCVPRKGEFDLGRTLALRFVGERLPSERETVYDYFRGRGAYSQLKSLLQRVGQLDAWYTYEQEAIETALRHWCPDNGFNVAPSATGAGFAANL
jgi:hypothetical protein